ncbi:MAG: cation:proton antiporter [Devosia sp.]
MTSADLLSWVTLIALAVLGLALLISVVRIIIGPTLADRVLALDLMTVIAMGFVATIAIRTGLMLYLDIAIALALLGFLATIALARYIMSRAARTTGDAP